jgi:hypothetical protein
VPVPEDLPLAYDTADLNHPRPKPE